MAVSGGSLSAATDLCRWLGFAPGDVAAIDIHVTATDWTVTVKRLVYDEAGELVELLQRFDVTLEERLPVRYLDEVEEGVPSA